MRQETHFTEKPKEIYFENFSGTAPNKAWMRRNIKKQTVTPEEGDAYGETWQPGVQDEGIMDNKELTEGFNSLQSGQLDLYDAIASLYETASL